MPESPPPSKQTNADQGLPYAITRLEREYHPDAAARLTGFAPRVRGVAKRSSLAFEQQGIPLDYVWGSLDHPGGHPRGRVRHVCLMAPGSGKTGMVFVSGVDHSGVIGPVEAQIEELAALVRATTDWVRAHNHEQIHLLQALPEASDLLTIRICQRAGYTHIGELQYLEGSVHGEEMDATGGAPASPDKGVNGGMGVGEGGGVGGGVGGGGGGGVGAGSARGSMWPEGISVRTVKGGRVGWAEDVPLLTEALERSYEQTLDCPELCGLRDTADVLESHRLAGEFDPQLWYLVLRGERAVGCAIFTTHRSGTSVELVYLGLAPEVRGLGLGSALLRLGIREARDRGADMITCAVDARNAPALALYQRAGMRPSSRRIAYIAPTRRA